MATPAGRHRGSAPTRVLVAVPHLVPIADARTTHGAMRYCAGVWSSLSRRRGTVWSAESDPIYHGPGDFWTYVESIICPTQCLVILAPIGTHLLTTTGFWGHVEHGTFRLMVQTKVRQSRSSGRAAGRKPWLGRMVLRGTPTIVTARHARGSLKCLSVTNYTRYDPHRLIAEQGITPHPEMRPAPGGLVQEADPRLECLAVSRWYRGVIAAWVRADIAPWADTAGAVAVSLWRGLDGQHAVRRHLSERAAEYERAACHGGRAAVWCYAAVGDRSTCPPPPADPPPSCAWPDVPGMVHRLDVSSQYPSILRGERFPCSLKGVHQNVDVKVMPDWMRYWGVIASVRLTDAQGEYPVRTGDGSHYPHGPVTCVLAGPELARALADGLVESIPLAITYRMGTPFRRWASYVLSMRRQARSDGDMTIEVLWKMIANAFGGKFAQQSVHWVPVPGATAPVLWGEYPYAATVGEPVVRRRALSGIPHERRVQAGTPRLPLAVYAYLTAHGRVMMRRIRDMLPVDSVVAQHTDGLWVTDAGLAAARAAGILDGSGPGSLRLVSSHRYARFYDPSHYYCDGGWTFAGVASGWVLTRTGVATESRLIDPTSSFQSPSDLLLREHVRSVRLDQIMPPLGVRPDGWLPGGSGGVAAPYRRPRDTQQTPA